MSGQMPGDITFNETTRAAEFRARKEARRIWALGNAWAMRWAIEHSLNVRNRERWYKKALNLERWHQSIEGYQGITLQELSDNADGLRRAFGPVRDVVEIRRDGVTRGRAHTLRARVFSWVRDFCSRFARGGSR